MKEIKNKEGGKPVWLSEDLLEHIEKEKKDTESPNQYLERKHLREDQSEGLDLDIYEYEEDIKEMVDDRIEHHKHR